MTVVAPGGWIGILGGGQLGRMLAQAAARLGYRVHIYCPEAGCPAAQVADRATVADYLDLAALDGFADAVDVVTLEFENVPVDAVRRLAGTVPVRPGAGVLAVAQDRLAEKDSVNRAGIATTAYARVDGVDHDPCVSCAVMINALARPLLIVTELGPFCDFGCSFSFLGYLLQPIRKIR